MAVAALALLIALAAGTAEALPTLLQSPRDGGCGEWRACRQLALAAAERGEYENFHDLAWRAVQSGPPKDPSLMYLLARAQALSGRPHDALIMLQRLTEMGVAPDATNEDFSRARELRDWPEVEARIAAVAASGSLASAPSPAPRVSVIYVARNTSRPFLDQTVCRKRARLRCGIAPIRVGRSAWTQADRGGRALE